MNEMTTFTIRLPDELNAWLEEQARLNRRSKNKQIGHILGTAWRMSLFNPPRNLQDEVWLAMKKQQQK